MTILVMISNISKVKYLISRDREFHKITQTSLLVSPEGMHNLNERSRGAFTGQQQLSAPAKTSRTPQ